MYVCREGEADELAIGATQTFIAVPSATTGGAYCILDQIIPAGLVSPAHRHEHEDQAAYVLEGKLGFWVEGSPECEASAGAVVLRPRGALHAIWNPSNGPARILEITSPGEQFERWMRQLSDLTRRGAAEEAEVRNLANGYGITFAEPHEDPALKQRETHHDAFWTK
jgi:quercetin dioxygenase-like cupin family protein